MNTLRRLLLTTLLIAASLAPAQAANLVLMIGEDEYCVDILMQLSAATGALGKVGQIVLENHLKTCVQEAMTEGKKADREEKLQELIELFRKYANVID